jgi:RNA polymerase sigma-70 factor (ECF subfamily)
MADAQRGSVGAFEALFARYYDGVYHYARSLLGDDGVAADVAQETFLRAHRSRDRFDPARGTVRAWLFAIAANRARTHSPRVRRDELPLEHARDVAFDAGAGDAFFGSVRRELVAAAVAQLAPELREVIALKYQNDLSFSEVASVLGLNASTVKMRAVRARELLARKLAPLAGRSRAEGSP